MNESTPLKVGSEVRLTIKGVTNDRLYKVAGTIVWIGGAIAKVKHRQPWARWHNCMRISPVMIKDLKPYKRRIPVNTP